MRTSLKFNKNQLKKLLHENEVTITSFCEDIGVSPSTISMSTGVIRESTADKIKAGLEDLKIPVSGVFAKPRSQTRLRKNTNGHKSSDVKVKIESLRDLGFNSDQILLVLEQE